MVLVYFVFTLTWHYTVVEVNPPSPQTSYLKLDNPLEDVKQVESDWDKDLDSVDYRARPPNDERKSETLMRKHLNIRGMPLLV